MGWRVFLVLCVVLASEELIVEVINLKEIPCAFNLESVKVWHSLSWQFLDFFFFFLSVKCCVTFPRLDGPVLFQERLSIASQEGRQVLWLLFSVFRVVLAVGHEWIQINPVMKTGNFHDSVVLWNDFHWKWNKTYHNKLFQSQWLKILNSSSLFSLPVPLVCQSWGCVTSLSSNSAFQFLFWTEGGFDPLAIRWCVTLLD